VVSHKAHNLEVAGSIPALATKYDKITIKIKKKLEK
jgi:hypothetical protein